MKIFNIVILILCIIVLLTACSQSHADGVQDERFKVVYRQSLPGTIRNIYILEDTLTGIKYLHISHGGLLILEEK